jgi:hypothetical protein
MKMIATVIKSIKGVFGMHASRFQMDSAEDRQFRSHMGIIQVEQRCVDLNHQGNHLRGLERIRHETKAIDWFHSAVDVSIALSVEREADWPQEGVPTIRGQKGKTVYSVPEFPLAVFYYNRAYEFSELLDDLPNSAHPQYGELLAAIHMDLNFVAHYAFSPELLGLAACMRARYLTERHPRYGVEFAIAHRCLGEESVDLQTFFGHLRLDPFEHLPLGAFYYVVGSAGELAVFHAGFENFVLPEDRFRLHKIHPLTHLKTVQTPKPLHSAVIHSFAGVSLYTGEDQYE